MLCLPFLQDKINIAIGSNVSREELRFSNTDCKDTILYPVQLNLPDYLTVSAVLVVWLW